MDELGIIEAIRSAFYSQKADLSDDVAFVKRGRGYLVLKADMFVKSTDLPPGMTLRQASRKAVVACISDLLCKGASPWGFLVSLGLPRDFASRRDVRLISQGLRDASVQYDVPILGGDVNEAEDLVIDVSMAGYAERMVRRSGSKAGDVLVSTGPFGLTALGLGHLLRRGPLPRRLAKSALASVYEPAPKKGLCKALVEHGIVNASMDSSDGLAITLNEMANQSSKEFIVTSLPADADFLRECDVAGLDSFDLIMHGGEEYEAVLSVPLAKLRAAQGLASELGMKLFPFGRVRQGSAGVKYSPRGGGKARGVAAEGWVHLR